MGNTNYPFSNPALPLTNPDMVCELDCDPLGAETTSDLQSLIQDVMHILMEDLGSNLDDPNRGVGIYRYLSGTQNDFRNLIATIESQLSSDPRIDSVSAQIQTNTVGIYPYTIVVNLGVNGSIIGLSFGWSSVTGLVNTTT